MVISPARQLVKSYRFREAVEAYKRQLREGPDDEWANTDGLGHALMAAGEFAEAIPYLEKVGEYASSLHPGALGRQIELSICHWMIGDRMRALGIIKELVIGVRDRKIHYTEISGGASYGLVLCYMATTLRSSSDIDLALNYLTKLATRRRIQYWPGPAALFLLGRVSFDDAMKDATGFTDLPKAKKAAEEDLMTRRKLTNILFAAGVERRMSGEEAGCRFYMVECASLTNPQVEEEWYLARGEISAQ
jgi:tetratricopeptide (TPR) repeat protein